MPMDDFEKYLKGKHGNRAEEFLALAYGRRLADDQALDYADLVTQLYRSKNATFELSLDVASQFTGRQLATYLSLFQMANEPPAASTVVDIGCDNGITTCFYAQRFPNARVIGIDRCAEGIECAKALAAKLAIPNITFIEGDAFSGGFSTSYADACDLITMILCGYEALLDSALSVRGIISTLMSMLKSDGTLIVLEPSMEGVLDELAEQTAEQLALDLHFDDNGGNPVSTIMMFAHKTELGRDVSLPSESQGRS